ncbi:protein of unknown function [Paraburkholderia dioscoreae]|uniref:NADH:flavin oxidoreductase/NADH oxidase N-terminal domain-containing protein n=1 Tax=Paraburkholderia dioscoreae TaxID=2604047 RepID=A0A5Q4Z9Z2_9BURK|nr:protein of unknown function [Paraburkholderia dioscoreae]
MYGVEALAGWKKVVDAVHAEGTPILAQLWHVGQMKQHTVDGLYEAKGADYKPPRRVGPSGLFGGIGKPTITVGSIGMTGEHIDTLMGDGSNVASLDNLLQLADRGDFDLIAVGRGMLVNPDWANKVREGRIDQLNNLNPEVLNGLI